MGKCLIIANMYKDGAKELGEKIKDFLATRNIDSSIFLLSNASPPCPFVGNDFVITLGGDGTVLFAARGCVSRGNNKSIPIFSVNLGTFGFLASIQKECWEEGLNSFLNGDMGVEERSMIKAVLHRKDGDTLETIGLNEVLIGSRYLASIARLSIDYNGIALGNFGCDGVIVSTATGSTAYSLAAGGPIIDPMLDAFVLTLINPFSLSSRPLVIDARGTIRVTMLPSRETKVMLTLDGDKLVNIGEGDYVDIGLLENKVLLVGATREKFYTALRTKLKWAGGQHA